MGERGAVGVRDSSKAAPPGLAHVLAALVGAPLVAFTVGASLVAFAPLPGPLAFAWGLHLMVPLWVVLACVLPLMRTGRRAWGVCLGIVLPLAGALAVRSLG